MKKIILVLCVALVAACTTGPTRLIDGWGIGRANTSAERERKDWALCGGDFYESGSYILEGDEYRNTVFDCMRAKGYRITHRKIRVRAN